MSKNELACRNRTTGKFKVAGYKSDTENYTDKVRQKLNQDFNYLLPVLFNCLNGCKVSQTEIKELFLREISFQFTNERKCVLKPLFRFREPELDQAFQHAKRFGYFLDSWRSSNV